MKYRYSLLLVTFFLAVFSSVQAQIEIVDAYPNLSFDGPIDYQFASTSNNKVYVAERPGRIRVFENDANTSETQMFLDIENQVNTSGEGGLLGFDFHPEYETNGYLYVHYTAGGPFRTVVSRFEVSASNPDSINEESEMILLELDQPYQNHNGGQIGFGPDGFLYIALGDGGSGGDPLNSGQDRSTLLGALLRIDVDNTEGDLNYAIPADNPFAGNEEGYREEIYAYGLRNPYRFSFDSETGELWVGDVGQSAREEIDVIEKGGNYGWNTMEGSLCYEPSTGCDTSGLELPVFEYGRSEGQSITGGYVYRGSRLPELEGRYIYGDFGSGRIWSLAWDGETASDNQLIGQIGGGLLITFGQDQDGEVYFGSFDGNIYTFESEPTVSSEQDKDQPENVTLNQNYPNPFNPTTQISFELPQATNVDLRVYDMLGREVAVLENGRKPAGLHEVSFDGSAMTSGIYIYKLTAGAVSITRKMTLLK